MRLESLIEGCEVLDVKGDISLDVDGIACDSRKITRGSLFVALKGSKKEGEKYIEDALKKGASALMVEGKRDNLEGLASGVPLVSVANGRRALGQVSARYYGEPSSKMKLVGITGTNGKTTTTYLLESIIEKAGYSAGIIGTVNYRYGGEVVAAEHTTPDAAELQKLLADMVDANVTHCVMEVSSHSLHQERVWGCSFNTVVFTNLTQDHLDYHGTMEGYGNVKRRLFSDLPANDKKSIINIDDPFGKQLAKEFERVISYGFSQGDISVVDMTENEAGTSAVLESPAGRIAVESPLMGKYNMYNIMAAAGVALTFGMDKTSIEEGIRTLKSVPGRIERVPVADSYKNCRVFVDYAHTPDALKRVIDALTTTTKGRVITLFGCGGDRDREKRALMGRAAARGSDFVIVTSDNPRTEDPLSIIRDIENGVMAEKNADFSVIVDRREAIYEAARMAGDGDTVIIAGKGHEDYQIIGDTRHHFDDREEALTAFDGRYCRPDICVL